MATLEAKTLAAVCVNRDAHQIVGENPQLFGKAYAPVAKFITEYYTKHRDVPSLETVNEFIPDAELEPVEDATAHYLGLLKNKYVATAMRTIMERADDKILDNIPAPEVYDFMVTQLSQLGKYTATVRDLDITNKDAAEEYFDRLRQKAEANDNDMPGISTGFESIDSCYPTGMAPGHSIVVMGYTGRGKSMWADVLAVNIWRQNRKVMIISLEMSPEEQRERLFAMMSKGHFKISDLSRGDINPDDFRTFAKDKLADSSNLIVVSNQGASEVTPNVVQAKIDMHQPDVVILDYLQLFMDNGKTQAMTPRMLNLSREIKLLAVSNNIPIISITAVTDEDGDKRDSPPQLRQVAWSRGIEYDANLAIAIHRSDQTDVVECVGRKNRHGDLFDFYYSVDWDSGTWDERFD